MVWTLAFLGSLGVLSRWSIERWLEPSFALRAGPTLTINVLGCAAAGALYAGSRSGWIPPFLATPLLVGFCGGFTTFSAYTLQSFELLKNQQIGPFLLIFFASPPLCLLSFAATAYIFERTLIS